MSKFQALKAYFSPHLHDLNEIVMKLERQGVLNAAQKLQETALFENLLSPGPDITRMIVDMKLAGGNYNTYYFPFNYGHWVIALTSEKSTQLMNRNISLLTYGPPQVSWETFSYERYESTVEELFTPRASPEMLAFRGALKNIIAPLDEKQTDLIRVLFHSISMNILKEWNLFERSDRIIQAGRPSLIRPVSTEDKGIHFIIGAAMTPTTSYDLRSVKLMQATTQILQSLVKSHILPRIDFDSVPYIVQTDTARGREERYADRAQGVEATIKEGILSLNQLFSLALAEPVPQADTAFKAIQRIVQTPGLLVELTRLIPVGMLGPMSLRGDHFSRLLIEDDKGNLTVEYQLKDFLRAQKKRIKAHVDRQKDTPDRVTGVSCPMAGCESDAQGEQFTGLNLLAEAYLYIYKTLETSGLYKSDDN